MNYRKIGEGEFLGIEFQIFQGTVLYRVLCKKLGLWANSWDSLPRAHHYALSQIYSHMERTSFEYLDWFDNEQMEL